MRDQIFRTRITEFFGIRHPIVCGGLMWLADARYVSAVVNAGGMGFITAWSFPDPEAFRDQLRLAKSLTGGTNVGVNISVSRRPGINEMLKPHVEITCEEGIRFVETSGSSPSHILPQLHEAGIKVIHKVPSVRYAKTAVREGVDAIAVVGAEAGGHPGYQMTGTMVQAGRAPQEVSSPLLVGGGIGTGAQILGVLAMGADGVLLGTRMLVAEEIWAHKDYKARVVSGDGDDSVVVMSSFKQNHRVLRNAAAEHVLDLEATGTDDFEAYRELVSGQQVRKAYESGDFSIGMIDYGQAAGFANRIEPVERIFDTLIDEMSAARSRLAALAPPNPEA